MPSKEKIKESITKALRRAFTQDQIYDLTDLVFDSIYPLIEEEKPKWEDAPPWANFLARDSNGYWYWYENEPDCDKVSGLWLHEGYNYKRHFKRIENWKETLETRPL